MILGTYKRENRVNKNVTSIIREKHNASGLFANLEKRLKLERYFAAGFPVQHLPKALFILMLGLIYISNAHYMESTARKINYLQIKVEDLRADYTTLKADLMFSSKQSEVARRVKAMGLRESLIPPQKVIIKNVEH